MDETIKNSLKFITPRNKVHSLLGKTSRTYGEDYKPHNCVFWKPLLEKV